jgi:hypothetical protein
MLEQSGRPVAWASGAMDLGTEGGRAFLQERLAFLGGVGFLFQCGFFLLGRAALAIAAPTVVSGPLTAPKVLVILADVWGQVVFLALWLYARRGRRPLGALRALDVAVPFAMCTGAVPLTPRESIALTR